MQLTPDLLPEDLLLGGGDSLIREDLGSCQLEPGMIGLKRPRNCLCVCMGAQQLRGAVSYYLIRGIEAFYL